MSLDVPTDLTDLSVSRAAHLIKAGRLNASDLVEALLLRIAEREPLVKAWAFIDPAQVRRAARILDRTTPRGPLHGVPVGIKDVISTFDQPTAYNSPIYAGHRPSADAVCVARLREAGAIVMGKTVTTEFAFMRPGPTRNPHDPTRSPGGSSSGSAAAVADRMIPAALGTQTGGSTIRPAAYCGIIGYKPAFGHYDTRGLKYLAPSLDTIGLMARDLDDLPLISAVLAGGAPSPVATLQQVPAFALFFTPYSNQAEPTTLEELEAIAAAVGKAGARLRRINAPDWFSTLDSAHRVIMAVETARSFTKEWCECRSELSVDLANFIERGLAHTNEELAAAWSTVARARRWLAQELKGEELILTLATAGEAPLGLATTGSAIFNRLWTILHAACLTVPAGRGPHGMPLGVQLVDLRGEETHLISVARWLLNTVTGGSLA